ncbi:MAG: hypothetical protein RLZZ165_1963 [Bacteroidota bacterium]
MSKTFSGLGQTMVEAYGWGASAKAASAPFHSWTEVLAAPRLEGTEELKAALAALLEQEGLGIGIFEKADLVMDGFPAFEELREYLIDLCVVRLLSELDEDPEVFESPQWMEIEDATADRGTELLNVLVYIQGCKLADTEPDLEDFLYEFLLADEEEYQEELEIYEPFIQHMKAIEAPLKQLIQIGNHGQDSEMREIFTPVMLFFREAEEKPGKLTLALLEGSALPELHCALYRLLCDAFKAEI